MYRFRIQQTWTKMRDALVGSQSKELGVFLFFFVVSAGFWLLQALDESFETELTVPLELVDVPNDVVITTSLPNHVSVTIRDKGTQLLRYWNYDMQPISLSFPQYDTGMASGRVRVGRSDVVKALTERLLSTSLIQKMHPDTLEFFYNHGLHATRPVAVAGTVETSPHFYLLDLKVTPAEVKVYASAAMLDTLTAVPTMPLNITNLSDKITRKVRLSPIRGAKIEPEEVEVTATVDVYMENTIEGIPVVMLNFPADKRLQTFPSTVKVTYTVGYARSREITRSNFIPAVTYEEILELQDQGATKIPIRLKSIPEGITNVRVEPQEVDYLIETVKDND